ncbi:MAG: molecular chaperone HtpG [Alphaproteobacteria bacterium]
MTDTAQRETFGFQAEVSKLLDLMIHSLYREKDIFLRELISNASDACDKLRYAALTDPALSADDPELKVMIEINNGKRTLSVTDNGIGMNRAELIENLGTIARSGTEAFVKALAEGKTSDVNLIGQFGVGFYSVFMVAERVEVITRRAGETEGWRWESAGSGNFTVTPEAEVRRGTSIVLHLREDASEFLEPERIRHVVATYSDHIALPIKLMGESRTSETLNTASALWTRPKSEITEEKAREFYHHVAHMAGDPWLTVHLRAEGRMEYAALLFVPDRRPFDLFEPDRRHRVKLYVKRVFITDDCEGLLPRYLRFLRGVVDSNDLPLNISRETLQNNPLLARIKAGLVKRVLGDIEKKASDAPADYAAFWQNFGPVLKEGIYEDQESREALVRLARFRTLNGRADEWASLDDYVARMPEGQSAIYYITGDSVEALRKSPQVEGFRSRGLDVLLLADAVDHFWLPAVGEHKEKPFRSVNQGGADLAAIPPKDAPETPPTPESEGDLDKLIAIVKLSLGEEVKDVRRSDRLTDSAVCLVADAGDMDMHLERLLRSYQREVPAQKRILELNPGHRLIRALAALVGRAGASDTLEDAAHLLLDQARIVEGEPPRDPAAFSKRLADILARAFEPSPG